MEKYTIYLFIKSQCAQQCRSWILYVLHRVRGLGARSHENVAPLTDNSFFAWGKWIVTKLPLFRVPCFETGTVTNSENSSVIFNPVTPQVYFCKNFTQKNLLQKGSSYLEARSMSFGSVTALNLKNTSKNFEEERLPNMEIKLVV